MRVDWRKVSHIGAAIVGTVVPGVEKVENLAWSIGGMHGDQKQNAVVELVKQALEASHTVGLPSLSDDKDVEAATRAVIDAVVKLQAVIAHKTTPAGA